MTHVDYFKSFFQNCREGTAKEICDYLIHNNASFNCEDSRRCVSVNSHLRRECGKRYPTGIVRRRNVNGVYVYFTEQE